jgi:hypothetical protein
MQYSRAIAAWDGAQNPIGGFTMNEQVTENGKGEAKAKELNSIFVEIFPDFDGSRVARDIRYGDGENKFTVSLPVPRTDEEAGEFYSTTLAALIEKGVKQHSYDRDTLLGAFLKAELEKGTEADALAEQIAEKFEDELSTEPERKAPSGEKAALKQAKAELGMSVAEMVAFIKEQKAQG